MATTPYIPRRLALFPEQRELLYDEAGRALQHAHDADATAHFLSFLLWRQPVRISHAGWVPVAYQGMRDRYGASRTSEIWEPLAEEGVIEVREFSRANHLCREFRVVPELVGRYYSEGPLLHEPADKVLSWGFQPGQGLSEVTCRPRLSHTVTASRNAYPDLIVRAIRELTGGLGLSFDGDAFALHLQRLETDARRARKSWERAGSPQDERKSRTMHESKFLRAEGRYLNDRAVFDGVKKQGARPNRTLGIAESPRAGSRLWTVVPAYDVQPMGRLTQIGGLQNATRLGKYNAFRRHYCANNYDLESAHAHGLRWLFAEHGVPIHWLNAYLYKGREDYVRRAFADPCGRVPDGADSLFKRVLYALMNSARWPATCADPKPVRARDEEGKLRTVTPKLPSISRYLREAFGADADEYLGRLGEVLGDFLDARDRFHEIIVGDAWLREHAHYGRGGRFVRNAVGATLNVAALRGWELRAKITAHLLQGLEQELVDHLIVLGPAYAYKAMQPEHDGLIVAGEIPQKAFNEALGRSMVETSRLKKKRFVD